MGLGKVSEAADARPPREPLLPHALRPTRANVRPSYPRKVWIDRQYRGRKNGFYVVW